MARWSAALMFVKIGGGLYLLWMAWRALPADALAFSTSAARRGYRVVEPLNWVVRRQLARGETSFLHVMRANEHAHLLYLDMGFRDERETPVRVVTLV